MANIMRRGESREMQQRGEGRPYWIRSGCWATCRVGRRVSPMGATQTFVPAFDVRERNDACTFEADLPGIGENDLDISVTGNRLSVSGKREAERRAENDQYFCAERSYGTFLRTFTLPDDAETERVNAEFRDGVLQIDSPSRPRRSHAGSP